MTWPVTSYGEYLHVKHGYAFKGEHFDTDGPYVLLTPGSFNEGGGFRDRGASAKFYTGDVPDGFVLDEGDLVVAMTEQAPGLLGSSAWIPEGGKYLHNQRLGRIVNLDEGRLIKRFVYYLFNTRKVRDQISATATGGKVRHTAPERIRKVAFRLPPIGTQLRICDVLSAYDDLLENNGRRMALLEEAARQLFREWFARLRFPGHEHTPVIDGVPEGWEPRTLAQCVTFRSGGTPAKSRPEFWEGDIPWVSSGEMADSRIYDTALHVTADGVDAGSRLVSPNTILAVVRGMSLAKEFRIAMVAREMAFNQDLKALECRDGVSPLFLFHSLLDRQEMIRDLAGEAAHGTKKLETVVLERLPVLLPREQLQRLFVEAIQPMVAQRDNLHAQNVRLQTARDLLLPRLMSGELAI